MRILAFLDLDIRFDEFEIVYVYDENEFYEKIINKKFDVLLVSMSFFKEFLEIKNYIKNEVVFINEYCDIQMYKKALEYGDYCYTLDEFEKLRLRLLYLQKKIYKNKSQVFKFDEFLYNFKTKTLYKNSEIIKLSRAEIELLENLIKNRNGYMSKEDIVMSCDSIESESSIKVLISHLRKIGLNIVNQKNLGYKLKEKL